MEFKLNRSDSQRQMHEQEHAFRQLSRLTRLERLVINGRDVRSTDSLDLRLQSRGGNLEKLATLRRLVTFDFDYTTQAMSELEISWMLERWPRLRGLMGSFSGIYHEDKKLQSLANFKLYERAIKEQGYE
ncbi:hypothetical protein BGZ46_005898 [Entomortierella lignicola]|nr:hypothetical protein BGZ46_005898 [Entomortierella lignicola]